MRRLALALVGVGLVWAASLCFPLGLPPLAECRAQDPQPPVQLRATLLGNQQFARVAVIGGRIEVVALHYQGRTLNNSQQSGDRREQLTVSVHADATSLRYDLQSNREHFTVHIASGDRAMIRRRLHPALAPAASIERAEDEGEAPTEKETVEEEAAAEALAGEDILVEYEQIARQPVVLTITVSGQSQRYEAASLWHLLLEEPAPSREHLLPMLDLVRPDWQLARTADDTKHALLRAARSHRVDNAPRWASWVNDLAAERFSQRQKAERNLRGAGQGVLPYLQGLERRDLDAEQWRRVQEILASYRDSRDDTAEQNVVRLLGDKLLWLGLLGDDSAGTQQLAAEHLARLTGAEVVFDAAASEAERKGQIAALRQALERK